MWKLENLFAWAVEHQAKINEKWVPVRPLCPYNLRERLYGAWMVLIGKADIFTWPEGQ